MCLLNYLEGRGASDSREPLVRTDAGEAWRPRISESHLLSGFGGGPARSPYRSQVTATKHWSVTGAAPSRAWRVQKLGLSGLCRVMNERAWTQSRR